MGRELIIQRSLARVRSSLYFFLNDVLFHPYPHDHFLRFPSLGSNPIGCWFFYGNLCKWSSIALYYHYHHPTVLIWWKYCLKGRKIRVTYPPVPFHSKPGSEILFYFTLNENLCCDPSLESFRQADSNEGSQLSFNGKIMIIIPKNFTLDKKIQ